MPGGAVVGREEFMRLLDPEVEFRGFKPAVTHKGTFNGSPLIAAGAVAAMKEVATGEHQRRADEVAARLRGGIKAIMESHQVRGTVYGESSTFHVYFGECPEEGIAALGPERIRALREATARKYGVEEDSRAARVEVWWFRLEPAP